MRDVTPYDTGAVLEPQPWLYESEGPYLSDYAEPAAPWGKVDFDNDEGTSICMVQAVRSEGGSYIVHVHDYTTGRTTTVEVGV